MAKMTNVISSMQSLSGDELVTWLEDHNITETALGKLVGQSQRNVSRMTTGATPVPAYLAVIISLLNSLSQSKRNRILNDLREATPQVRSARKRSRGGM